MHTHRHTERPSACVLPKTVSFRSVCGSNVLVEMLMLVGTYIPNIHAISCGAVWFQSALKRFGGSDAFFFCTVSS